MVARKLELRRLYGETARAYDKRYEKIQRAKYIVVTKNLPGRTKRILDLGCGTGMFLGELSKHAEFVVGADASLEMLQAANVRRGEATLVLADADHLPFTDGSFDVVVSVTLLQNMPDPAATARDVARVLRPGGRALLTVLKRKHPREELERWVREAGFELLTSGEVGEDVFCAAER